MSMVVEQLEPLIATKKPAMLADLSFQMLRGILKEPAELAALSIRKGWLIMTTYEWLSLLIAFLTLIVTILK